MSNGAPPPIPGTTPAKKGLSPLAWVGIGCGGLLVLGFVVFIALTAFVFKKGKDMVVEATGSSSIQEMVQKLEDNPAKAAAELAIRVNPDLELIATDDEAGTITFRNTKKGEEATVNFEDIAEGRLSVTTNEGEFSVSANDSSEGGVTFKGPEGETRFGASADLSDVPDWVTPYPGSSDTQSSFHSTTGEGMMGALTSKTSDSPQEVVDHYKKVFEDSGYEIGAQSMTTTGNGAFGAISGERKGEGKTLNVVVMGEGEQTTVTINYNLKQQ